jgi:hypothetical protein
VHRNARLTPQGRLLLCRRIEAGWPEAHAAEAMGIYGIGPMCGGGATAWKGLPGRGPIEPASQLPDQDQAECAHLIWPTWAGSARAGSSGGCNG